MNPIESLADILVVGGGVAAVAAAQAAREAGRSVVVVAGAEGASGLSSGALGWTALDGVDLGPAAASALAARLGATASARDRTFISDGGTIVRAPAALAPALALEDVAGELCVVDVGAGVEWRAEHVCASVGRYVPTRVLRVPLFARTDDALLTLVQAARRFDDEGLEERLRSLLVEAGAAHGAAISLPPLLGLRDAAAVATRLRDVIGWPVGETLGPPGSPPGLRLGARLRQAGGQAGRWIDGWATEGIVENGRAAGVRLGGGDEIRARTVVLATGGLVGGGIVMRGELREPLFGLDISLDGGLVPTDPSRLFGPTIGARHPLERVGVNASAEGRPAGGAPESLFVAGQLRACGMGLLTAAATGAAAGRAAAAV